MPPLPPNITKAGLLRSISGWNNSSLSRRSGTTVGLLSTRTPHSSGNSGGGIPNPSYGVGTIREAFPRGATGAWRPISLATNSPFWTKYANGIRNINLSAGDNFGVSVAVSGSTIVVGAEGDDSSAGAAWVSTNSGTSWTKYANGISNINLSADYYFGSSVAVDGSTIVVGAYGDDTRGGYAGAVWVSTDNGSNWTKSTPLDLSTGDNFGSSVAVDGSTIVVGANGGDAVWVSTNSGTSWTKKANGDGGLSLNAFDYFGTSVAVSGSTIVVGAEGDDTGGDDAGAAWVSTNSGTSWTKKANGDGGLSLNAFDYFGTSVAVSGSTIVVGANGDDGGAGAVWVSTNSGTSWTKYANGISNINLSAGDNFGVSVAVSGSTIVVGAEGDDSSAGAAWVSTNSGTSWTKYANGISGISLSAGDYFGVSVAVDGSTIVVGAEGDDSSAGAIWVSP